MTLQKYSTYKLEIKPDVLSMIMPGQDKVICYKGTYIH
jgi:hypothetical protein